MAIQLREQMWTEFDGSQVSGLIVRRRRLDYRRRLSTSPVRVDTPIESVSISDDYMNEFAVVVRFTEPPSTQLEVNDPVTVQMVGGWYCQGRVQALHGKTLALLCPVASDHGIPRSRRVVTPAPARQLGLPAGRQGWQR